MSGCSGRPGCRAQGARPQDKGGGLRVEPAPSPPWLIHTHTHTLMHTHTNMHTQIRTACFLPSAKYRSTRRGFKGSHSSPNRRVNILRRSPCYSPSSLSPPLPALRHAIPVTHAARASPRLGAKLTIPPHTECLCQGRVLLWCRSTQLVHLSVAFSFELSHVAPEVTEVTPGDWVTVRCGSPDSPCP